MKCLNDYIVNVKNLKDNVLRIKKHIGKDTKFCAIVKANGYGIGSHAICKYLSPLVDFYGVANLKEALAIRLVDKKTKILILGAINKDEYKECADNNISVSVSSMSHLNDCIANTDLDINIHIQINTGLNRFGFSSLSTFKKALKIINCNDNIHLEGIYSHFATKDKDKTFIRKQFYKFLMYKKVVPRGVICHIANSFATTLNSQFHLDMVRCGFLMYTGDDKLENKCVITIKSKIINIFNVKSGESVGYDRSFMARKKMRVAVVAIGYADGLDRRLSNKFYLLVHGVKCSIVGNICMDVCMIDVSNVECLLYDDVMVLGVQGKEKISLYDYANALDTSAYEILLKFRYSRMNYIEKLK